MPEAGALNENMLSGIPIVNARVPQQQRQLLAFINEMIDDVTRIRCDGVGRLVGSLFWGAGERERDIYI